jgi:predicted nucleotidyltransferase
MTPLRGLLRRVAGDLDALGAKWALVGGLAVSTRTEPRFTRDIDLAVSVADDREAQILVRALRARGWEIGELVEQEAVGRVATVRLCEALEGEGPVVDLLLASSGIEPEVVEAAQALEVFEGQTLPVATVAHLIVLKLLARASERPQDEVDLRALVGVALPADFEMAREAARAVERRGFARGRDLVSALDRLLQEDEG